MIISMFLHRPSKTHFVSIEAVTLFILPDGVSARTSDSNEA